MYLDSIHTSIFISSERVLYRIWTSDRMTGWKAGHEVTYGHSSIAGLAGLMYDVASGMTALLVIGSAQPKTWSKCNTNWKQPHCGSWNGYQPRMPKQLWQRGFVNEIDFVHSFLRPGLQWCQSHLRGKLKKQKSGMAHITNRRPSLKQLSRWTPAIKLI